MSTSARGGIVGGTFTPVGNDVIERFFHRAGLLANGQVMVSGGLRVQISPASLISLNAISFFEPATNSFSATFVPTGGGPAVTPTLLTARSSHTQTLLIDGRVLITGGHVGAAGSSPGTPTATVEVFQPATGVVSPGPAMTVARADHSATVLPDGRVVVAGGPSWQVFDAMMSAWSADRPLQHTRVAHAAVSLPNHAGPGQHRVLVIGGAGTGPATLELLDPDAGTSVLRTAVLTVGVDDPRAARMNDGSVFIVGGQDVSSGDTVGLSYRYDPIADVITSVPSPPNLPSGVSDHQLVRLDRFALIFGGESQTGGVDTELNAAAIFDGGTGAWSFTSNMTQIRDDAAAVALDDGRVLLIAGAVPFFSTVLPTRTAEVFVPQQPQPGDVNGDSSVDVFDVSSLVDVLLDPAGATTAERCGADVNGDGSIDGRDVQAMADVLFGP